MGISKNNLQNKLQQEARQVPHFGIRKLAIGTASVLLSTSLYFGAMGRLVQANANVATGNNVENEKINSGKKDIDKSEQKSTTQGEKHASAARPEAVVATTPSTANTESKESTKYDRSAMDREAAERAAYESDFCPVIRDGNYDTQQLSQFYNKRYEEIKERDKMIRDIKLSVKKYLGSADEMKEIIDRLDKIKNPERLKAAIAEVQQEAIKKAEQKLPSFKDTAMSKIKKLADLPNVPTYTAQLTRANSFEEVEKVVAKATLENERAKVSKHIQANYSQMRDYKDLDSGQNQKNRSKMTAILNQLQKDVGSAQSIDELRQIKYKSDDAVTGWETKTADDQIKDSYAHIFDKGKISDFNLNPTYRKYDNKLIDPANISQTVQRQIDGTYEWQINLNDQNAYCRNARFYFTIPKEHEILKDKGISVWYDNSDKYGNYQPKGSKHNENIKGQDLSYVIAATLGSGDNVQKGNAEDGSSSDGRGFWWGGGLPNSGWPQAGRVRTLQDMIYGFWGDPKRNSTDNEHPDPKHPDTVKVTRDFLNKGYDKWSNRLWQNGALSKAATMRAVSDVSDRVEKKIKDIQENKDQMYVVTLNEYPRVTIKFYTKSPNTPKAIDRDEKIQSIIGCRSFQGNKLHNVVAFNTTLAAKHTPDINIRPITVPLGVTPPAEAGIANLLEVPQGAKIAWAEAPKVDKLTTEDNPAYGKAEVILGGDRHYTVNVPVHVIGVFKENVNLDKIKNGAPNGQFAVETDGVSVTPGKLSNGFSITDTGVLSGTPDGGHWDELQCQKKIEVPIKVNGQSKKVQMILVKTDKVPPVVTFYTGHKIVNDHTGEITARQPQGADSKLPTLVFYKGLPGRYSVLTTDDSKIVNDAVYMINGKADNDSNDDEVKGISNNSLAYQKTDRAMHGSDMNPYAFEISGTVDNTVKTGVYKRTIQAWDGTDNHKNFDFYIEVREKGQAYDLNGKAYKQEVGTRCPAIWNNHADSHQMSDFVVPPKTSVPAGMQWGWDGKKPDDNLDKDKKFKYAGYYEYIAQAKMPDGTLIRTDGAERNLSQGKHDKVRITVTPHKPEIITDLTNSKNVVSKQVEIKVGKGLKQGSKVVILSEDGNTELASTRLTSDDQETVMVTVPKITGKIFAKSIAQGPDGDSASAHPDTPVDVPSVLSDPKAPTNEAKATLVLENNGDEENKNYTTVDNNNKLITIVAGKPFDIMGKVTDISDIVKDTEVLAGNNPDASNWMNPEEADENGQKHRRDRNYQAKYSKDTNRARNTLGTQAHPYLVHLSGTAPVDHQQKDYHVKFRTWNGADKSEVIPYTVRIVPVSADKANITAGEIVKEYGQNTTSKELQDKVTVRNIDTNLIDGKEVDVDKINKDDKYKVIRDLLTNDNGLSGDKPGTYKVPVRVDFTDDSSKDADVTVKVKYPNAEFEGDLFGGTESVTEGGKTTPWYNPNGYLLNEFERDSIRTIHYVVKDSKNNVVEDSKHNRLNSHFIIHDKLYTDGDYTLTVTVNEIKDKNNKYYGLYNPITKVLPFKMNKSLDKGPKGDNGKNGTNGINGKNGESIINPRIDTNGDLWVTVVDANGKKTNKKIGHVKGAKGDNGINGKNGESFIDPHVDEKGDLWVTVVDANGNKSKKNIGHVKGAKGDKGDKGDSIHITGSQTLANGDTEITFSDGQKVIVKKGDKGEAGVAGKDAKIKETKKDKDGNTVIVFEDGTEVTVQKGDKGDTGAAGKDAKIKEIKKDKDGNTVIVFEDGKEVTVQKGDKGDKGDSIHITGSQTLANGDTEITFSDGQKVIVKKGDKGETGAAGKDAKVKETKKDQAGNTVIVFEDGTEVTVQKGDKGETGAAGKDAKIKEIKKDQAGNTVIVFEDGKEVTVQKGDKGEKGDSISITGSKTLANGDTEITFSDGQKVIVKKGDKGETGAAGKDGQSITNATIDQKNGHLIVTIGEGADAKTVDAGPAKGADGKTPHIKVSDKVNGETTITIDGYNDDGTAYHKEVKVSDGITYAPVATKGEDGVTTIKFYPVDPKTGKPDKTKQPVGSDVQVKDGVNGKDGKSVTSAYVDAKTGHLMITIEGQANPIDAGLVKGLSAKVDIKRNEENTGVDITVTQEKWDNNGNLTKETTTNTVYDGVGPKIEVAEQGNSHIITITDQIRDREGIKDKPNAKPQVIEVKDGKDGETPTITKGEGKDENGHVFTTVTFTTSKGSTTVVIPNGKDGKDGKDCQGTCGICDNRDFKPVKFDARYEDGADLGRIQLRFIPVELGDQPSNVTAAVKHTRSRRSLGDQEVANAGLLNLMATSVLVGSDREAVDSPAEDKTVKGPIANTYKVEGLLDGMVFNPEDATITGKAKITDWKDGETSRRVPIRVTVYNSDGSTKVAESDIVVTRTLTSQPSVQGTSTPDTSIPNPGKSMSYVGVVPGTRPYYTLKMIGRPLPKGIQFDSTTGTFTGTAKVDDWQDGEVSRIYPFVVTVVNCDGKQYKAEDSITIYRKINPEPTPVPEPMPVPEKPVSTDKTPTSGKEKLPQTGETSDIASLVAALCLAAGLVVLPKKKEED
ncbi:MAG: putative Ig domain-containing protein [Lactobacillus iners]|nr:putative Ig domain-containing protein [Lactobacillus iners]